MEIIRISRQVTDRHKTPRVYCPGKTVLLEVFLHKVAVLGKRLSGWNFLLASWTRKKYKLIWLHCKSIASSSCEVNNEAHLNILYGDRDKLVLAKTLLCRNHSFSSNHSPHPSIPCNFQRNQQSHLSEFSSAALLRSSKNYAWHWKIEYSDKRPSAIY